MSSSLNSRVLACSLAILVTVLVFISKKETNDSGHEEDGKVPRVSQLLLQEVVKLSPSPSFEET